MDDLQLIHGDARHLPLADNSVQCIVTSPPYWGFRKYAGEQELIWDPPKTCQCEFSDPWRCWVDRGFTTQSHCRCECHNHIFCEHEWVSENKKVEIRTGLGLEALGEQYRGGGKKQASIESFTATRGICVRCGAWRGAFGLEPTIEMYVAHSCVILAELWRVLRPDGVVFWNIGDSYAAQGGHADTACNQRRGAYNLGNRPEHDQREFRQRAGAGLKPKDLCLIPERIALAAQAMGFWVRSRILWCKPNPMPESVTDRPADAAEHIWMFTKSPRYFWDADAVREASTGNAHHPGYGDGGPKAREREVEGTFSKWRESTPERFSERNLRNVWTFATQPYPDAHFATFPEELPRICIRAATSEKGACAQCGAPWVRVTRPSAEYAKYLGKTYCTHGDDLVAGKSDHPEGFKSVNVEYLTVGWRPGCTCRGQRGKTVPCLVVDPFGGSGTTGRVALELGRRAVLVDVAYSDEGNGARDKKKPAGYRALADARTRNVQRPLL